MAEKMTGLFPPIITCFGEDGKIDERAQRDHVNFLIENGVHGVIPCGSTGEFINLTEEEYKKVAEIVVDEVNDRVPVIIGAAAHSTKMTIKWAKFAESLGANGVLIVPPYYQVLTQEEVREHYKAVSEAISIPIMLYNNPPVSSVDVQPETIAHLANEGIISYVKEAQGDPARIQRIIQLAEDNITVFYGHDINALGAFAVGAVGWVSGMANTTPKQWRKIFDLCVKDKDYVKAKELWYKALAFVNLVCLPENNERANWISYIKEGLEMRGRKVGKVRRPMLSLSKDEREKLKKALKEMGII